MKQLLISSLLLSLALSQIMRLEKHTKTSNVVTTTGKMTLDNYRIYLYYGNFTIGTPAQNITIVQDIGSNQLWVPEQNPSCYVSSSSTSANITSTAGSIQYGPAMVAGYMGTEVFGQAQLGLGNLTMTTLFVNKEVQLNNVDACGAMGLSNDPSWKNFLQVAQAAGQLSDSQFAYQLKNSDGNVYFYAGSAHFPTSVQLTWLPAITSNNWIISLSGTMVRSTTYSQPSGLTSAFFDTSFNFVLMANNAYNGLLNDATISSQCQQQQGYVLCPCLGSGFPTVYFKSNNHILSVLPQDYLSPLSGQYCMLGFAGVEASEIPFVILGDVFIKNYFFALDKANNQIGLSGSGVHLDQ